MKCIVCFFENGMRVILDAILTKNYVSWPTFASRLEEEFHELSQMKFKIPSIPENEKMAKIIKKDFLQQNAFSDYDYNCPLYKTIGMMKCIVCFFENGMRVILDAILTKNYV